jgi:DNA modification methylase
VRDFPAILVVCGLRSYLTKDHADKSLEIGQEKTPEAFVETMVQVFREVRRCLHESGTLWLNLGDTYAGYWGDAKALAEDRPSAADGKGFSMNSRPKYDQFRASGIKPKDLCGIPWRVALALQADGWWLRSVICWHKKSCMPESVTDRPTNSWEPIFLLAKSQRYFYDSEAVKEPSQDPEDDARRIRQAMEKRKSSKCTTGNPEHSTMENWSISDAMPSVGGRNQRNVWTLGPEPYSEAHFATLV